MGDVEDGELKALSELVDDVEDLEPDRDVEHRDRLVCEQHARPDRERARDRDALALAARELVWVPPEELLGGREVDLLEQPRELGRNTCTPLLALVKPHGPLQRIAHLVHGVERCERILEEQLHVALVAPERPRRWMGRRSARRAGPGPPSGPPGRRGASRRSTCPSRSRRRARRSRSGRAAARRCEPPRARSREGPVRSGSPSRAPAPRGRAGRAPPRPSDRSRPPIAWLTASSRCPTRNRRRTRPAVRPPRSGRTGRR